MEVMVRLSHDFVHHRKILVSNGIRNSYDIRKYIYINTYIGFEYDKQ